MSTVTYRPNPRIGAELARVLTGHIKQGGFVMEREAKRRTPVDTGHLRNSYHVDATTSGRGVVVTVGNNAEYAIYVEFGTSNMSGRHMLSNAVQAAGRWLGARGFKVEYVAHRGA